MLRTALLLSAFAAFVVFSVDRFQLAAPHLQLDLPTQSDDIGDPARRHLEGRLAPGTRIGCIGQNPDWPDECDYLYYSLLPYFVRKAPAGQPAAAPYVLFAANPRAPESPREQASAIPGYRIELELPRAAFLLAKGEP